MIKIVLDILNKRFSLISYQHLVSLKKEHVLELSFGQLMSLVKMPFLHFPDGGFASLN